MADSNSERTLFDCLNIKITYYLSIDNPVPKAAIEMDALEFFSMFFSPRGKEGRTRANSYRDNNRGISDSQLLPFVLRDLRADIGEGTLGSSKLLRRRLWDGVALYGNIKKEEIEAEKKHLFQGYISSMRQPMVIIVNEEDFHNQAIENLIAKNSRIQLLLEQAAGMQYQS